ncbi:hypothetical protein IQ238_00915 [Pleurocapsales cyanobacterium LEGE 06147]|nr:hypothetical protein [Pleurocapsales cyanobacterium LEGE 06147]
MTSSQRQTYGSAVGFPNSRLGFPAPRHLSRTRWYKRMITSTVGSPIVRRSTRMVPNQVPHPLARLDRQFLSLSVPEY